MGDYWQFGQKDIFESLPRAMILAWLHSDVDEVRYGTARAADSLLKLARSRQRESEELRDSMLGLQADILKDDRPAAKGLLIATAYQWLKAESDAALYRVQAEAIGGDKQVTCGFAAGAPSAGRQEWGLLRFRCALARCLGRDIEPCQHSAIF